MTGYRIAWKEGPGAQLEWFSPNTGTDVFRIKFSPPMRRTLRPPITDHALGPAELGPINKRIAALVSSANARGHGGARPAANIIQSARRAGELLRRHMMPRAVQMELHDSNLFVEIGLDEGLLEYPWELMHDGTDFFGCKHSVGRFVNISHTPPTSSPASLPVDALHVLVISVPNPQPRDENTRHKALPGAQRETDAVVKTLTAAGAQVTLLAGHDATWEQVSQTLADPAQRFHIIHYIRHATFNAQNPRQSSLILHDEDMTAAQIVACQTRPPVLFFVNGCETAKANQGTKAKGGKPWQDSFEIFGLAKAFLESGAYLLGTRWPVGDKAAELFASTFYTGLLEEKPLGTAVRDARVACLAADRDAHSNDFSWASYAYYGDPRVYFKKIPPQAPRGPEDDD